MNNVQRRVVETFFAQENRDCYQHQDSEGRKNKSQHGQSDPGEHSGNQLAFLSNL